MGYEKIFPEGDDVILRVLGIIVIKVKGGSSCSKKRSTIDLIYEGRCVLAKEAVAEGVHGVGFPPLPELIDKVVEGNVPVYV